MEKAIEELQEERSNKVFKFIDPENIASISNELGSMPESIWNVFIEGLEAQYNKRIEAEKKAEIKMLSEVDKCSDELQKTAEK